jgi:hypothetical protein
LTRIPAVDPEELRKLSKEMFGEVYQGFNPARFGVSTNTMIRHIELQRRYKLSLACLLPRFLRMRVFTKAATVPLESILPEVLERERRNATWLTNPTGPVIL